MSSRCKFNRYIVSENTPDYGRPDGSFNTQYVAVAKYPDGRYHAKLVYMKGRNIGDTGRLMTRMISLDSNGLSLSEALHKLVEDIEKADLPKSRVLAAVYFVFYQAIGQKACKKNEE